MGRSSIHVGTYRKSFPSLLRGLRGKVCCGLLLFSDPQTDFICARKLSPATKIKQKTLKIQVLILSFSLSFFSFVALLRIEPKIPYKCFITGPYPQPSYSILHEVCFYQVRRKEFIYKRRVKHKLALARTWSKLRKNQDSRTWAMWRVRVQMLKTLGALREFSQPLAQEIQDIKDSNLSVLMPCPHAVCPKSLSVQDPYICSSTSTVQVKSQEQRKNANNQTKFNVRIVLRFLSDWNISSYREAP